MTAKIYVEGGGPGENYDRIVRQAWKAFFVSAGLMGRLPRVVRGESRNQAFDLFTTALVHPMTGEIPLLLVDSEDPVQGGDGVWAHLRRRDGWARPAGANDDHCFLMVQVMETWIVADLETLREYFEADLNENYLPKWPAMEAVAKTDVLNALQRSTVACSRPYSKGKVSFDLLGRLSPATVEQKCPHARRLLDRLRSL